MCVPVHCYEVMVKVISTANVMNIKAAQNKNIRQLFFPATVHDGQLIKTIA